MIKRDIPKFDTVLLHSGIHSQPWGTFFYYFFVLSDRVCICFDFQILITVMISIDSRFRFSRSWTSGVRSNWTELKVSDLLQWQAELSVRKKYNFYGVCQGVASWNLPPHPSGQPKLGSANGQSYSRKSMVLSKTIDSEDQPGNTAFESNSFAKSSWIILPCSWNFPLQNSWYTFLNI